MHQKIMTHVKKILSCIVLLWLCVFSQTSLAISAKKAPLRPEQAFVLSVSFIRPDVLMATWQIAPGYYLYAKRIHFNFEPPIQTDVRLPQGEFRHDKESGRFEAYAGTVNVPISLQGNPQQLTMHIQYQGCSKNGFC